MKDGIIVEEAAVAELRSGLAREEYTRELIAASRRAHGIAASV